MTAADCCRMARARCRIQTIERSGAGRPSHPSGGPHETAGIDQGGAGVRRRSPLQQCFSGVTDRALERSLVLDGKYPGKGARKIDAQVDRLRRVRAFRQSEQSRHEVGAVVEDLRQSPKSPARHAAQRSIIPAVGVKADEEILVDGDVAHSSNVRRLHKWH